MNWWQAITTEILLGNLIVLIPMLLNAHAGAKYGIPFSVFRSCIIPECAARAVPAVFARTSRMRLVSAFRHGLAGRRFSRCFR